jgi:hypothetical protein
MMKVYHCPEGSLIRKGINIEENSSSSVLRLIIKTSTIQIYFRIRQSWIGGPRYICEITNLQQP